MIKLRDRALSEKITQLSFIDKEAQETNDSYDKANLQQLRLQYARMKNSLDDARLKMSEYRRE